MDILAQAIERIRDPEQWTQGCTARDITGKPTSAYSEEAVQWCLLGSVHRVVADSDSEPANFLCSVVDELNALAHACGYKTIIGLNDQMVHEELMNTLDRYMESRDGQLS